MSAQRKCAQWRQLVLLVHCSSFPIVILNFTRRFSRMKLVLTVVSTRQVFYFRVTIYLICNAQFPDCPSSPQPSASSSRYSFFIALQVEIILMNQLELSQFNRALDYSRHFSSGERWCDCGKVGKKERRDNLIICGGELVWLVIIIIQTRQMQQKLLLINSMEKLINHIVVSKKNQEEIFASLSKNDFKKIISNLEDENQRLRKISLALISQLLHNNNILKEKFCHIMNIPLCPGRIALTTKLCASSNRSKNNIAVDMNKNIKEVFILLKQAISEHEKQSLFWFINYDTRNQGPLQLEYLTTSQPQAININDLLDPVDCMIGFILPQRVSAKKIESFIPTTNVMEPRRKSEYEVATSNKLVNNYFKPNSFKPDHLRQYPPANLNQSMNLNPGYSTDRQPNNYAPKSGIAPNRTVNASMYQEPVGSYKQNEISSPMNHIKPNTFDIQNFNRSKYAGIKLISNPNTAKGKQGSKYFEQQPVYVGSVTTNGGKSISFSNGNNINGVSNNSSGIKNPNISMRERGYETLREKKIIEKYP